LKAQHKVELVKMQHQDALNTANVYKKIIHCLRKASSSLLLTFVFSVFRGFSFYIVTTHVVKLGLPSARFKVLSSF